MARTVRVAGVDGAAGGWMVAEALVAEVPPPATTGAPPVPWRRRPEVTALAVHADLRALLRRLAAGDLDLVCVDMPLGLPAAGRRACESLARERLGARRSSVFWSPPRGVLEHLDDYGAANARCRELAGWGLSKQAFHLLPRVAELDAAVRSLPEACRGRVREGHPELAFTRVRGRPPRWSKRSAAGVVERLVALESLGIEWLGMVTDPPAGGGDDVIDALVLCDTAAALALGHPDVVVVGDGSVDDAGLAVSIAG